MLAVHPMPMGVQGPWAEAMPPDLPEVAGTRLGLGIRFFQALIAAAVLAFLCAPTSFPGDPEFRWLALAAMVQFVWSLSLWCVDVYAALVKIQLRRRWLLLLYTIGDCITSYLACVTAWASAGIVILIAVDLRVCSQNDCSTYTWATVLGFINAITVLPCFLLNLWKFMVMSVYGVAVAA